jgi:hypothetical protein
MFLARHKAIGGGCDVGCRTTGGEPIKREGLGIKWDGVVASRRGGVMIKRRPEHRYLKRSKTRAESRKHGIEELRKERRRKRDRKKKSRFLLNFGLIGV